jgi:hypothetical protein
MILKQSSRMNVIDSKKLSIMLENSHRFLAYSRFSRFSRGSVP